MTKFCEAISPILRLWQLFGLTQVKIEHNQPMLSNRLKNYSIALIFIHSILFILNVINTSYSVVSVISKESLVTYLNLLLVFTVRFLSIVILAEVHLKRDIQVEILKKLQETDNILEKNVGAEHNYSAVRKQLLFNASFWTVESILMAGFMIGLTFDDFELRPFFFTCLHMLSFFTNGFRYLQYIMIVSLIKDRFEMIQQCLHQMNRFESKELDKMMKIPDPSDPFLVKITTLDVNLMKTQVYQKVVYLRQCYHLLWETTLLTNNCFRWTLPFAIGTTFYFLVANCYWMFLIVIHREMASFKILTLPIGWGIINIRRLIALCNNCNQAIEKVTFRLPCLTFF